MELTLMLTLHTDSCPRGDDPLTSGQVNEVQILRCNAKGGSFALYFNGEGVTVPFDATEAQLQQAFRSIKTMPRVKVTYTVPPMLCNSVTTNAVLVEFVETFGPYAQQFALNDLLCGGGWTQRLKRSLMRISLLCGPGCADNFLSRRSASRAAKRRSRTAASS